MQKIKYPHQGMKRCFMNRILIACAPLLFLLLGFHSGDVHEVTGMVTDENGAPLPGASVTVKGHPGVGVAVDNSGKYRIVVPDKTGILVFSGAGLETMEIAMNGQSVINASLRRIVTTGTEVLVTAYGMARNPKSLGYQVTHIRGDEFEGQNGTPVDKDEWDREGYDHIKENRFLKVTDNPLSTFSIDVDAAAYSNIRRFLNEGKMPPAGAVRIEELINYFRYEYPQPAGNDPFSMNTEISSAPWNTDHKLVLIGLQGRAISMEELPASNLVFLIDVSGSMEAENKLPLVKSSLKLLVDQLREQDRVSIVVYAGAAGLVLPPTSGYDKQKIRDAIDNLSAGGSTAGGAGIRLAYKIARETFIQRGNNRVILCTDGDFNVGESSDDAMERLIENERSGGVFLTVLGFGTGNYQDAKMQKLADKGNGNHAYIDGISEAKKVFVSEFGGTLFTIAKDVKLQVEFNPAKVKGYRLLGYENRMLAKEDFNNDRKDAGELGSNHTVTALYEIIPAGVDSRFLEDVDPLRYQPAGDRNSNRHDGEMLMVKLRYKDPDGDVSKLIEHSIAKKEVPLENASVNLRFAAAVAEFGMILRGSEFKAGSTYSNVISLATHAKGADREGYRAEFIGLVKKAQSLSATAYSGEPEER
jgi:Ca-activated chloride channel family protein